VIKPDADYADGTRIKIEVYFVIFDCVIQNQIPKSPDSPNPKSFLIRVPSA